MLNLPGSVLIRPTTDQLYDDLASVMVSAATTAVGDRGTFHVALSGGSTPEPFYERLVLDPRYRVMPWQQTQVWIVDERRVAENDEKSNYRMIRECLLDHLPMRKRQIHPMPVLAADAAERYEGELRRQLPDGRLDFVLLGMGDDAHTASLFPGSPAQAVTDRWVAVNSGPKVTPPDRVTMTYPLLNQSRELAVLVTGAKKHAALRRVDEHLSANGADPGLLPITGINPVDGELTWYLDAAAAGDAV